MRWRPWCGVIIRSTRSVTMKTGSSVPCNGDVLFGEYTFHLSAQSGQMVGVEKEEHLKTSWVRSLRMRHPWLQLNLLTAFIAAYVVGLFEDTIAQVVLLAVFLPVLAGQSGNTGCQSLAVTLRGHDTWGK